MLNEDNEAEDRRGEGFPQILHDRARKSAEQLHRLLVSLSTGAIAIYFLALTTKTEPALSLSQKVAVLASLLAMASAVLGGIRGWYADARRNYFWACALQATDELERRSLFEQRDRWIKKRHINIRILGISFVTGVLGSIVYLILRVVDK
jgi:hypothetical protein